MTDLVEMGLLEEKSIGKGVVISVILNFRSDRLTAVGWFRGHQGPRLRGRHVT